ncbi:phosphatase PAP2 family protein [Shewanella surugensis]|uniref:undecaprenyl-diphosphate phosphatase n=1 Tax=Shewanella surugensis TaxID=212020 RepID=A0ABT0LK06_9GAMM|nr:phosphatase PAP2 family protein [Shewanella surugensis]MCL1128018.1 phosphatase PAP2 family protein [Shewanella surugensis]
MEKQIIIVYFFIVFFCAPVFSENKKLTQFGYYGQVGVPLTAAIISLYDEDYIGFGEVIEGAVFTSLATYALKYTVREERPDESDKLSFPSGHTSSAAQGAAYLQFKYGWKYGLPAYAITGLVGYSRVQANKHYWHDVIAGALLGTAIQYAVTVKGYSFVSIAPYVGDDEVGLFVSAKF